MNFYLKKANIGLLVCLSLCFHTASAEYNDEYGDSLADFYGDEEFVSIATGSKKSISKAPAVASVITADDIKSMGARNLAQVLDTVPGLHVSRSGQLMAPEFWFRGITSTFNPQTLMMINGVSTKSSVRGDNHVVWGEFPIHSIERIEIIRGPGSALYGADAFSGVINIITKKDANISRQDFGAMVGSFNTINLWANNQIKIKGWTVASNLEYLESDGFDGVIKADSQTAIDIAGSEFNIPSASQAPGYVAMHFKSLDLWVSGNNENFSIDFGVLKRSDVGTGNGAAEALDNNGNTSHYKQIIKMSQTEKPISEYLSVATTLSYYGSSQEVDEDFLLYPEGAFFGAFPNGLIGNPEWEEETTKAEVNFNYSRFDKSQLSFGLGYERQNLYKVVEQKNFFSDLTPRPNGIEDVSDTVEVFMPEADRESHFFYFQSVSQIYPDWELTAGGRFDDYTDFGSTFNPRAALVWSTSRKLTSKLLYGRAFRAPAFAELIVINNPIALGNPNLKPETIDTYELAFNFVYSTELNFDFNLYHYSIEDFITFVTDNNGVTATAQNLGRRSGKGFEANLKYAVLENFNILTNLAYVKAVDDLVKQPVGEYPAWQAYLKADWKVNDSWHVSTQVSHVGERERVPGDLRQNLNGYSSVDFVANYQFPASEINLEFIANNLLGEDVREPSSANTTLGQINIPYDLPQAGDAFYVRLSTSF